MSPAHAMTVDRLAYIGVTTGRMAEWRGFAADILGMETLFDADGSLRLRMDEKPFRFLLTPGLDEALGCVGWECDSAAALLATVERVQAQGVAVAAGTAEECARRAVAAFFHFTDPAGTVVELCHGHRDEGPAPVFPRPLAGFKTGAVGLGHVVFSAPEIAPLAGFYEAALGFKLSDNAAEPYAARFLHINPRHHSLAFVQTPRVGLHHVMVELYALDDVGQAYDRALLNDDVIGVTLGRHSNDFMTSFYALSPSGFMVEYGWGGRMIDPAAWQAQELTNGPSLWGHERRWLSEAMRARARELRLHAADTGLKAAVQVTDGFYDIVSG
jgi:2,3-dihydroxybiphenyl 1,2-dioxygenase